MGMGVRRDSSSSVRLLKSGERCWTTTNAMPVWAGMVLKKRSSASSPPAARPLPEETVLRSRLGALRGRLRMVATLRGLGFTLATVLLGAALAGYLDWRFHLPALSRAAMLVLILTGAAIDVYRFLLRPL